MTPEEALQQYNKDMLTLDAAYKQKKEEIIKRLADNIKNFDIGDVVSFTRGGTTHLAVVIKIGLAVQFYWDNGVPVAEYEVSELTASGNLRKKPVYWAVIEKNDNVIATGKKIDIHA